ncbi:MAG TPA: PEP-CTERM sorting domain-containing protein [Candidatus Eisenbacteria bacterium]|nr:PEP-CTERM sorting domain-containing protein [Candidatus Eisenbacteria bacterium]
MKTPTRMAFTLWAMVGALAGAMTWGVGPARAGDAVSKSSQPYIAPIVPTFEKSEHRGRIGVGEEIRDHGYSLRQDLIKKRTIGDIIDRSKGHDGTRGGWIGGGTEGGQPPETIDAPFETQPISTSYRPAGGPPPAPEPSGFVLAGIGVAGLILSGRRRKR